jgi:hypothetical protein
MKMKSDAEIVETLNHNNKMQDIKSFKTDPNSSKLDYKKLR